MIHIFTDYGLNGPYAGQLRGVLACEAPGVPAVDLMHAAPTRNPCRSAYLLAALATEMAPGDVCIAVVDPGVGGDRPASGPMAEGWRDDPARPGASWPDDLAEAIYIDGFGNVMTGLRAAGLGEKATVEVAGKLVSGARTFGDVAESQGFWYENALGLVEIAVNGGSAARQYGIEAGAPVTLRN